MRPVTELYGRHPSSDIYVIGTGASLRVFPQQFLENRITIGLNMAWKTVDVMYGITIHPDLNIPEFIEGASPRPEITWIVKPEKMKGMSAEDVEYAEQNFYSFRTDGRKNTMTNGQSDSGRFLEWVRHPHENFLYLWTSISQSGVTLAAHMGAKNIILVGCDNAALLDNHHSHAEHTMWLDAAPDQRYRDYYEGLAEIRSELRDRGINLVSLTPFLTLGPHDDDFVRLCAELGMPSLIESTDITHSYRPPWKQIDPTNTNLPPASRSLSRRIPAAIKSRVPSPVRRRISTIIGGVRRDRP